MKTTKIETATAEELSKAREWGIASADADIKYGTVRWPHGSTVGLSGKHVQIQIEWGIAKSGRLESLGYVR